MRFEDEGWRLGIADAEEQEPPELLWVLHEATAFGQPTGWVAEGIVACEGELRWHRRWFGELWSLETPSAKWVFERKAFRNRFTIQREEQVLGSFEWSTKYWTSGELDFEGRNYAFSLHNVSGYQLADESGLVLLRGLRPLKDSQVQAGVWWRTISVEIDPTDRRFVLLAGLVFCLSRWAHSQSSQAVVT